MPSFDFTSPDGKTYSVDGPEGATPEQAFQILQQHLGGPSGGSSMGGVAKSLGTGLAEGVIGLAGIPGDLAALNMKLSGREASPGMGSDDIKKRIEQYTGEFYKPQGRAEQLANTAGQFLPAVVGGPETLGVKLATRVAAPAIASETAGALTGDNPYAKAGGALVGAVAGPMAFNRAVRAMRPGAEAILPDLQDLRLGARGDYQHPDVTAVRINGQATSALADTIEHDLQHGANSGFRVANEPRVFNAVNELRLAEQEGRATTVADLDNVRQVLGNAAKERDAQGQLTRQAVAANRAINHINDFLPNLNQADLLAGNAAAANARLNSARQDWGAYKRAQNVQTLASNAEINAASANSGANIQNATKQAFKPMLKNNAAKAVGYNDEELAALNRIVRGTWTGSATRAAGNLLGGGGGLGMLVGGAAGYHEGGLPGAIGVGLAGRGLKMMGNRSTLNAVANLDRLLRSRSPTALRIAAAMPPQVAQALPPATVRRLQAMIAADPILSQQLPQSVPANGQ